jgi:hypothetical protein
VSWPWLVVLALAAALVVAVEWPRLGRRFGAAGRKERARKQQKARLRVVSSDENDESDEFIRSVQRDLDALPTIEERDRKT